MINGNSYKYYLIKLILEKLIWIVKDLKKIFSHTLIFKILLIYIKIFYFKILRLKNKIKKLMN